jgi:hypothetical protein
LFVDLFPQAFSFEIRMLLHPTIRFDHFRRIGCGGENLCNQGVWIQGNRGYELLQFLSALRSRGGLLCRRLVGCAGEGGRQRKRKGKATENSQ